MASGCVFSNPFSKEAITISGEGFTIKLLFVMALFHSLAASIFLTGITTCREHLPGWIGRSKWKEKPLSNCSNFVTNAIAKNLKIGWH